MMSKEFQMSSHLFGRLGVGFATARYGLMTLWIGCAIMLLANSASGQAAGQLPPGYKPPPVVVQQPMDTATKPWT